MKRVLEMIGCKILSLYVKLFILLFNDSCAEVQHEIFVAHQVKKIKKGYYGEKN